MRSTAFHDIDRHLKLQDAIDVAFQGIEAELNGDGFSSREVHDAMAEVLAARRQARDEDPDPADDP